ncbi:MAG TPA: hypothetical protein VGQ46_04465 [Thermoanaerobaculia bacterium]|nr:hypothetical protein [Thermoanaerobaculia bacterium]
MPRHLLAICLLLFACSAAATELEPKMLGPTAGNVSFVSSAYAGGKFLTVWRQLFMPATGIWGAFSDSGGKPLGASFPIVPSTNAQYLNLFPRDDGFVLVWDEANRSSQLCQIDSAGRATGQTTIGPPGLTHAYATSDRIVAGRSIIDFDGHPIREVSGGRFLAAGRNSFLAVGGTSDLMLTRYSGDGQFLQQWLLKRDFCRTLPDCWYAFAARELDSGSILVVLANAAPSIETLILSPDGTVSPSNAIVTTLPEIQRVEIHQSSAHLWLILEGGGNDGATHVEATELDDRGAAAAVATTIIQLPAHTSELVNFVEGGGVVFAATSPTTADRQVQTFAFRSLTPVAPEIVSTTASIQADVQISSNGSGFLAVWKDTNGTRGTRWHWSAVDAAGQGIGPIFEGDGAVVRKSLVSNGLDYLVLLVSSNQLIARRLAPGGAIIGDTVIAESFSSVRSAAAVPTSNGYVITWCDHEPAIHSTVLTFNGIAGAVRTFAPAVPTRADRPDRFWVSPVLAWDGSAVLLTALYEQDWVSAETGAFITQAAYAMLLTSDGALVAGTETPLDPAFLAPTSAASSGSEFVVAGTEVALGYRDGARLRFIYPIRNVFNADVVWNGSAYVVARSAQGTATLTVVARDGSIGATTFRRGPEDVDAAADATGRVVLAGVESDGRGPLRAVAYSASELQPLVIGRSRAAAH